MRSTLILTLAMAGLSYAQVSSYNTVLAGETYAAVVSVNDGKTATYLAHTFTLTRPTFAGATGTFTAPYVHTTVHTYPPGYLEEIASLDGVITTEAAFLSIASVEAHATGVAGSAVTAFSSLRAAHTDWQEFGDPSVAATYLRSYSDLYTQLPTEVQSYRNSVEDRYMSIHTKYGIFNQTYTTSIDESATTSASFTTSSSKTSTTTATSTAGVERLGVGIAGYLAAAGAAGLGVAAVIL